jgi:hypothetical protein
MKQSNAPPCFSIYNFEASVWPIYILFYTEIFLHFLIL